MALRLRYILLLVPLFTLHAPQAHAAFSPDPSAFATQPTPASPTSITMTAVSTTYTLFDGSTAPVTYNFVNESCAVNGGSGGTSSDISYPSTTYVDSGLQPNKNYCYYVNATQSTAGGNPSGTFGTYTYAATPGAPAFSSVSDTTATLSNAENGNPASNPTTLFAVKITAPSDSAWNEKYVSSSGTPAATAAWLSDAAFDSLTLTSLSPGTTYTAQSKARNFNDTETAFGPSTQMTTTGGSGGDTGGGDTGGSTGTSIQSLVKFVGGHFRLIGGHFIIR